MKRVTIKIDYQTSKFSGEEDCGAVKYHTMSVTNEVPDGWLEGLKSILGGECRGYVGDCYSYYFQLAAQKDYRRNPAYDKDAEVHVNNIEITKERSTEKASLCVSLEYSYESDYLGDNETHEGCGFMFLPEDKANDLIYHTGEWENVKKMVIKAIEEGKGAKNVELTNIQKESMDQWEFYLLEDAVI